MWFWISTAATFAFLISIILAFRIGFHAGTIAVHTADTCPDSSSHNPHPHSWQITGQHYHPGVTDRKHVAMENPSVESIRASITGFTSIHYKCRHCQIMKSDVIQGGADDWWKELDATAERGRRHSD